MKFSLFKTTAKMLAMIMTVSAFSVSASAQPITETNINVGKGNSYEFNTIQDAIDSINFMPTEKNPVNIYINEGTYEECVTVDKPYVNIIGRGDAQDTIITYDKANGHEDSSKNTGTEKSATFTVAADAVGFSAENITFENSYNLTDDTREQTQAVALVSLADKVVFEDCRFIGRQDTLYLKGASKGQDVYGSANNARVYLDNCYIEGTVDFIFGDATAYFNECQLFMAYYENGGHFTAPNTTLFNLGYVFNSCKLSVDKQYTAEDASKIDLGRPWQADSAYPNYGSQAVYINCILPDVMNSAGFTLWDSSTVKNKVRFMEYGSRTSTGELADTSERADFVKQLTREQAANYNVYNVLSGSDGWNPTNASSSRHTAADITLDHYEIQLPVGGSTELNATVLPLGAVDSNVTYSTESSCISLDGNKVTAVSKGTAVVNAGLDNGIYTYAVITVTDAKTSAPEIASIKINHKDTVSVGDKLTAEYKFYLESDNNTDASIVSWYAVKDGNTTLLKRGVGEYYKTYTVQNSDTGSQIVLGVMPATKTTYGTYGTEVSSVATPAVSQANDSTESYLRDGFENGTANFATSGEWDIIFDNGNSLITPISEKALLEYTDTSNWDDASYEFKLRCNPENTGLSSDDILNFYINNSESSYYRLEVRRGGNTKSLKLNLYKCVDGEENAIYTDEDKLKNAVLQNSGQDNPYMYLTFAKNDDNITLSFRLEGSDVMLLNKTITDSTPLTGGDLKVDFEGKSAIWLIDMITVDQVKKLDESGRIRIYLAGDSTVKYYGDDNSIGGWGEYLVNYFDDGVEIINKAEAGRSTRSYINQGRLDEIVSELRKGDYVFIQFGHNDNRTDENARVEHSVLLGDPDENGIYPTVKAEKTKTPQRIIDFYANDDYPYGEYFYPYESGTFKWYLKQYVDKVREKGGIPVIITPVCRVLFDSDGKIQPAFGENNGYKVAVEQLAEETGTVCINAYDITKALYESYGVFTTQGLHDVKDDGEMDLTHYNKFGANIVASKLADAVAEQIPQLQSHLKASTKAVSKTDDMKTANLFVVGDSGKGLEESDIFEAHGFSEYFQGYLSDKITVCDYTYAGATAKTFAKTDEYKDFLNSINEGDYVMICFGRYDSNDLMGGYAYSGGKVENISSFTATIYNSYIKPVLDRQAIPIMLTPINSRKFDETGTAVDTVQGYDDDIKGLVTNNSLYFADLTSVTYELYNTMGEEGSKVLNAVDSQNGIDNMAFSEFGAKLTANKILNLMKFSSSTLKNYISDTALNEQDIFTRAEFTEKLAKIIGIENNGYTMNFKDIASGKSYEDAVGAAYAMGIVSGDSRGYFYPEAVLDADTMISMLKKALEYKHIDENALSDVYSLASGAVSNEIGLWALDRLCEEVNEVN